MMRAKTWQGFLHPPFTERAWRRVYLTELQSAPVICLICWSGFCKLHCEYTGLLSAALHRKDEQSPDTLMCMSRHRALACRYVGVSLQVGSQTISSSSKRSSQVSSLSSWS